MIARRLALLLALALLSAPLTAEAQHAGKMWRIGLLLPRSSPVPPVSGFEAFGPALRDLGYIEGQSIVIEVRGSERYEQLPQLAAELVSLKPDVIVAYTSRPVMAARKATGSIPIVMVSAGDPVGLGLVRSLARPGGNITGLSSLNTDLSAKRLELLREAVPGLSRVAVLRNLQNPTHPGSLAVTQSAAESLGLSVQSVEVRGPDHLREALASIPRQRVNALVALPDGGMFSAHRASIITFALANRLPLMYNDRAWVADGALLSYGLDSSDLWRRAAGYVDRILKGAKPVDLPVEEPTKLELALNLKTAKALGLTFSPMFLLRADRVTE